MFSMHFFCVVAPCAGALGQRRPKLKKQSRSQLSLPQPSITHNSATGQRCFRISGSSSLFFRCAVYCNTNVRSTIQTRARSKISSAQNLRPFGREYPRITRLMLRHSTLLKSTCFQKQLTQNHCIVVFVFR